MEVEIFQQDGALPHYSNTICDELGDFLGIGWGEEAQSLDPLTCTCEVLSKVSCMDVLMANLDEFKQWVTAAD
jgi:hypothetical protein